MKQNIIVILQINQVGVSQSDISCFMLSGEIHNCDVSWNLPKKVYHIVTESFVNL